MWCSPISSGASNLKSLCLLFWAAIQLRIVRAEQFLSLAQQTWPGAYTLKEIAAALRWTTNIGAWDGDDLWDVFGSSRTATSSPLFPSFSSCRSTGGEGLGGN